ncbi:hypothetical protein DQ226_03850 [Dietzia maris]|uniref:HAD family hydrolase n=1 Tax=Dietzia maris TaxID=37915 RepID=A0A365PCR2_9ACTN|nr:hypothetical protein DQ226_03850 [Dietzia maris]
MVVGDHVHDVRGARAAGAVCVAVATGRVSADDLRAPAPTASCRISQIPAPCWPRSTPPSEPRCRPTCGALDGASRAPQVTRLQTPPGPTAWRYP